MMHMRIRPEQMEAFRADQERRYLDETHHLFRDQFPDLVKHLDDDQLRSQIRTASSVARGYGIESPKGTFGYVALALHSGPNFNTDPIIRRYFNEKAVEPDVKVEWLFKTVVEQKYRIKL